MRPILSLAASLPAYASQGYYVVPHYVRLYRSYYVLDYWAPRRRSSNRDRHKLAPKTLKIPCGYESDDLQAILSAWGHETDRVGAMLDHALDWLRKAKK